MKKYCCLLSIFIVMLIASCSSLHIGGYSERYKEEALLYLGNDMISLIEEDDSIDPSVFISGLPPEYTVYSSYSPIYDDQRENMQNVFLRLYHRFFLLCISLQRRILMKLFQ